MTAMQTGIRSAGSRALTEERSAPTDLRFPGVLLLLLGVAFLTATMLAASVAPGYDFHGAAISDLGVTSETALMFNVLLVGIGVLNIVGGYLLYRSHQRLGVLAVFVAGGIGAMGAGFFPLSTGSTHSLFALFAFVFFNVEALATGLLLIGPMRLIGNAAGLVGLAYVVVMVIGDSGNPGIIGPIGHGGAERLIAYPAMLWLVAYGGYLMGRPMARPARTHGGV